MKSVAVSNMSGLAEARGTVLGMSLDRMSDSIHFFSDFSVTAVQQLSDEVYFTFPVKK